MIRFVCRQHIFFQKVLLIPLIELAIVGVFDGYFSRVEGSKPFDNLLDFTLALIGECVALLLCKHAFSCDQMKNCEHHDLRLRCRGDFNPV